MTHEEIERWEGYWRESAQRDFERDIYKQCDKEDSMKDEFSIAIKPDGTMSFIYDDRLAGLCEEGDAHTTRASHVEPAAEGGWSADMAPVNGPILGPFRLREDALAAEVAWLNEHLF